MTTITTGPDGEALFDGMPIAEVIFVADMLAELADAEEKPDVANGARSVAAALRHLSAQPDPLTVTGTLRWEDDDLYLGRLYVGSIDTFLGKPVQFGVRSHILRHRYLGYFHDADTARVALVEAVKEATGG